jgi:antitoxin ParD1/3/4
MEMAMNISLTPKLENFVKAKVKSGNYNNASEVVREALRVMQERDAYRRDMKRLRDDIRAGEASGVAAGWDLDRISSEIDRRARKRA